MNASYTTRVSRVIELLQGKWTILILCAMRSRPVRLSELRRLIPTASKKALTASLGSLTAQGFILRRDLSSSVLHVEYELADAMQQPLVELLEYLEQWATLYVSEEPTKPPTAQKHRHCSVKSTTGPSEISIDGFGGTDFDVESVQDNAASSC
jgi:DNA-binding HxlR family transcriptional regulator